MACMSSILALGKLGVLPGGNLFICNAGGKVGLFETTRDKRVVWQSRGGVPIGHGIQRMDVSGSPLK